MELILLALLGIGASAMIFDGSDDDQAEALPEGDEIDVTDQEAITGSEGDDTISGGEPTLALDSLSAGGGNDLIDLAFADTAQIDGGDGNDTINAVTFESTISGGEGDDEMNLRPQSSWVNGDAGDDVINVSQSFNQSSTPANGPFITSGPSFISGGEGDDILNYEVATDPSASAFELSGGEGADTITLDVTTTDYAFTQLPEELLFEFDEFGNVIGEVETPVVRDTIAILTDFEPGVDQLELDLRDTHDEISGAHTLNLVDSEETADGTALRMTFDSARPEDPDASYQIVATVFLQDTFGLDLDRDVTLFT
ncbi:Hemolysin-type calcium-binding repeat (2 copies) [Roseovarius sp. THAF9]|uniref:hypothetical protein n=1 Tax=Roseovarius sp. THAF9 TaxID=2587847 RepID=UPI0012687848|nr:hypothetical protein [Roseovarius sp. THAF9]QFT91893.1 Hemolysin-type calcium-binding repeat (2 copies) [Roseovarius sp. THAF9]